VASDRSWPERVIGLVGPSRSGGREPVGLARCQHQSGCLRSGVCGNGWLGINRCPHPPPAQATIGRIPPGVKGERRLKVKRWLRSCLTINLLPPFRWRVALPGARFEVMEPGTTCPYPTRPQGQINGTDHPPARQYSPAPKRHHARSPNEAIHLETCTGQGRSPPRPHHCAQ
jgi:hypothetical protein